MLGLQLWHNLFIDLLNKVRVGNIHGVENLFKAIFICESDKNCPTDALHMHQQVMKINEAVLNDWPGELSTTGTNCKCTLTLIQATKRWQVKN